MYEWIYEYGTCSVYTYAHVVYTRMYVCMYVHVYVIHVCICMYVCRYTHVHVYMYTVVYDCMGVRIGV